MASSPKIVVVSNRLAVSVTQTRSGWKLDQTSGGLKSALEGYRETHDFLWYGWPGVDVPREHQPAVADLLKQKEGAYPVFLDEETTELFYNQFCNALIWPLFHYLSASTNFHAPAWEAYCRANQAFADALSSQLSEGDLIWIHDFHLMLLPQMIRKINPRVKIGFFLHIPFPSSEIYRLLSVRSEILMGMLGADLIGFHTYGYARHFRSACLHVLGLESTPDLIHMRTHDVRVGVFPVGIEVEKHKAAYSLPEVKREVDQVRAQYKNKKIIVGIDRLDHSKGLEQKLRGFERFLEKYPDLRSQVVLIQLMVPSRIATREYRRLKRTLDELVGHINGAYSTAAHSPVHYLFTSVSFEKLVALYRSADMALVTPLRDGMNLVSQEYVLSQEDQYGVLILSEFAGAAHSLSGAILVNPGDKDQIADAIHRALEMDEDEKKALHALNMQYIEHNSSRQWGERFISTLSQCEASSTRPRIVAIESKFSELSAAYKQAQRRVLLLDYDGTLREFVGVPSGAKPQKHTYEVLEKLADDRHNFVFLVSGRDHDSLESWFKGIPIGLCAEHGYQFRYPGEKQWKILKDVDLSWRNQVLPILENFRERTPGSFIEIKSCGFAWHYRLSDPEFGLWQARELLLQLEEGLSNVPVDILPGHKVVEIRAQGISKGIFAQQLLASLGEQPDFILCIGDDETDEHMFEVLPDTAWTCRVGSSYTRAKYMIDSPQGVKALLRQLIEL